jgi:hypothetical protein
MVKNGMIIRDPVPGAIDHPSWFAHFLPPSINPSRLSVTKLPNLNVKARNDGVFAGHFESIARANIIAVILANNANCSPTVFARLKSSP